MIVVKVELHSARDGEVTEIGRTVIANDGTGDRKRRNYDVAVGRRGDISLRGVARPVRRGRVENYPAESYSVWRLVIRALRSAFPEERA